jgi:hypothetical protein
VRRVSGFMVSSVWRRDGGFQLTIFCIRVYGYDH